MWYFIILISAIHFLVVFFCDKNDYAVGLVNAIDNFLCYNQVR